MPGRKRERGPIITRGCPQKIEFECLTGLYRDSVKEEDAWCRERKGNDGKVTSWVDAGCLCAGPFVGTWNKGQSNQGDNHFSLCEGEIRPFGWSAGFPGENQFNFQGQI